MPQGRCSNFGNGAKADSSEVLTIPDGQDMICPLCKHQLSPIVGRGTSRAPVVPLMLGALLLLVVGILGFAVKAIMSHRAESGGNVVNSSNGGDSNTGNKSGGNNGSATPVPFKGNIVMRLQGSTTIGTDLAPALVEAFLKKKGATSVSTVAQAPGADGKTDTKIVEATFPAGTMPDGPDVGVEIQYRGSDTAFTDMKTNKCDIGMASRPVKPDEQVGLGDLTSPANEHVLALDGIAIIVGSNNPFGTLSKGDLASIFSGKTTNWSKVNNGHRPIKLYARDENSGTHDTFQNLVLGKTKMATAQRFDSSEALVDAVAKDPDGIGYVSLSFVKDNMPIKAVAIGNGAAARQPTVFTVQTEDYLLSRRLYLYTPTPARSALASEFVQYTISDAGQDVVKSVGFVGQSIPKKADIPLAPALPPDAPGEYAALVKGATRLPFNFRFRTGSDQLDNKALADLGRFQRWIVANRDQVVAPLLIGFADSTGAADANMRLSKSRAATVAAKLNQAGLYPAVNGFGSACPVADNSSDGGREQNRRVEVWVKTR